MQGKVEIYRGDELIQSESNMIMDGASELIVDILTANPSLSAISSASAILDASNYTVQALSFGHGPQDNRKHARNINTSAGILTSGCMAAVGFDTCSYDGRLLNLKIPTNPNPTHTRLEPESTLAPIVDPALNSFDNELSGLDLDLGQYLNTLHTSATNGLGISSLLVGAYPASGGTNYRILKANGNWASGGIFKGKYNIDHVMDSSGFIHMTVSSAQEGKQLEAAATGAGNNYSGVIMTTHDNLFSGTANAEASGLQYKTLVSAGDLGGPALYGGIWVAGLWVLDLKTLLADGKTPPYSFDTLNNQRKYRLFAKKVFTKPITYHRDSTTDEQFHPMGGLDSFEEDTTMGALAGLLNSLGLIWTIRF